MNTCAARERAKFPLAGDCVETIFNQLQHSFEYLQRLSIKIFPVFFSTIAPLFIMTGRARSSLACERKVMMFIIFRRPAIMLSKSTDFAISVNVSGIADSLFHANEPAPTLSIHTVISLRTNLPVPSLRIAGRYIPARRH